MAINTFQDVQDALAALQAQGNNALSNLQNQINHSMSLREDDFKFLVELINNANTDGTSKAFFKGFDPSKRSKNKGSLVYSSLIITKDAEEIIYDPRTPEDTSLSIETCKAIVVDTDGNVTLLGNVNDVLAQTRLKFNQNTGFSLGTSTSTFGGSFEIDNNSIHLATGANDNSGNSNWIDYFPTGNFSFGSTGSTSSGLSGTSKIEANLMCMEIGWGFNDSNNTTNGGAWLHMQPSNFLMCTGYNDGVNPMELRINPGNVLIGGGNTWNKFDTGGTTFCYNYGTSRMGAESINIGSYNSGIGANNLTVSNYSGINLYSENYGSDAYSNYDLNIAQNRICLGNAQIDDSYWYAGVQLYRQQSNNWYNTILQMGQNDTSGYNGGLSIYDNSTSAADDTSINLGIYNNADNSFYGISMNKSNAAIGGNGFGVIANETYLGICSRTASLMLNNDSGNNYYVNYNGYGMNYTGLQFANSFGYNNELFMFGTDQDFTGIGNYDSIYNGNTYKFINSSENPIDIQFWQYNGTSTPANQIVSIPVGNSLRLILTSGYDDNPVFNVA